MLLLTNKEQIRAERKAWILAFCKNGIVGFILILIGFFILIAGSIVNRGLTSVLVQKQNEANELSGQFSKVTTDVNKASVGLVNQNSPYKVQHDQIWFRILEYCSYRSLTDMVAQYEKVLSTLGDDFAENDFVSLCFSPMLEFQSHNISIGEVDLSDIDDMPDDVQSLVRKYEYVLQTCSNFNSTLIDIEDDVCSYVATMDVSYRETYESVDYHVVLYYDITTDDVFQSLKVYQLVESNE